MRGGVSGDPLQLISRIVFRSKGQSFGELFGEVVNLDESLHVSGVTPTTIASNLLNRAEDWRGESLWRNLSTSLMTKLSGLAVSGIGRSWDPRYKTLASVNINKGGRGDLGRCQSGKSSTRERVNLRRLLARTDRDRQR